VATPRKRLLIPALMGFVVLLASANLLVTHTSGAAAPKLVRSVSMTEAYTLAEPHALSWDSQAKLYWINSVDQINNTSSEHGLNGTRSKWNVEFVVPGTDRHFTVVIFDGRVAASTEFANATMWEPFDEFPALPVGEILKTAKSLGLEPGTNFAFGYHFKLHKRDGSPTLEVIGKDKGSSGKKQMAFDPFNGKVKLGSGGE